MSSARHLSATSLDEYLVAGVPAAVAIAGTPAMTLQIDPSEGVLGIRGPFAAGDDVEEVAEEVAEEAATEEVAEEASADEESKES